MKTERLDSHPEPLTEGVLPRKATPWPLSAPEAFIPIDHVGRSLAATAIANRMTLLEERVRELRATNLELQRALRQTRIGWAITCLAFGFFLWWSLGWRP